MGVIVQRMIDAEGAGVAFGADPLTGDRDVVVISALYGIGEGLVSGELDADTFRVRGEKVSSRIVAKTHRVVFDRATGVATTLEQVPEAMWHSPALSDRQAVEIAAAAREMERLFAGPQDVEWCIADGRLHLLQSRPITTLPPPPEHDAPAGPTIVWDNSNIIESYAGVTTPLTFSFIRDVYSAVYREFCRILGVDEETIKRNAGTFEMLGLIRGRVYYNLLNWYRMLALLPGYSINARFMEGMMGVRERLEETPSVVRSGRNPWRSLLVSIYRLLVNLFRLPTDIVAFQEHLDATLAPLESESLASLSPAELVATYAMLEQSLLLRWRVPILNDFYTMIFFGSLKKMIERSGVDDAGTLHNDLISGEGGIISTEPSRRLRGIANSITGDPALLERARDLNGDALLRELESWPEVNRMVAAYLAKFGDRYVGELKLETMTPRQQPAIVGDLIASYLRGGYVDPEGEGGHGLQLRRAAEKRARQGIRGAFRSAIFRFVLGQARERVKNRENLRFERTRVFGVVRRLFLALGEHFQRAGGIDSPRDIFYLTKEEIFAWVAGVSVSADLRALIDGRKSEFDAYGKMSAPDRFTTRGLVYADPAIDQEEIVPAENPTGDLTGIPCCPGMVRGRVRKIVDPATAPPLDGAILVAERTDPGWVPLFPTASAILVERGSQLSHSAIVAREMGIPAIVGISGLMRRLEDGMEVEMDGGRGTVRIIG
jgi:pyruvate,water dikinase